MTELELEFQTICHRTLQAEKRLARQQAVVAMLTERGQAPESVTGTMNATNLALTALRARRSEMAKKLRYRARKSYPR